MAFVKEDLFLTEEDKATGFWVQDEVHLPYSFTPLYASFQVPAMSEGTKKAFETLKLPIGQFQTKIERGYIYQWNVPYEGDPQARLDEHIALVQERFPRVKAILFDYVNKELLSFYQSLDEFRKRPFNRDQAVEKLHELHAFYKRAWELHFEIVMPRMDLGMALEDLYGKLAQTTQTAVIYDWLVGVMNKSLETDRELWKLAERAKQSAELRELFAKTPVEKVETALEQTEAGRQFLTATRDLLEEYGYRATNSHEFVEEIWVENPAPAFGVIARYLETDYDFEQENSKLVEERKSAFEAVVQTLPDGEAKQAFLRLYQFALDCWGLDEDHHFYIDAMLPAKSRLFLLEVGKLLVQEGIVDAPQDVFFFYLDELAAALQNPTASQELIAQRKREHEANKQHKPAPAFGQPPQNGGDNTMIERIFGLRAPEVEEEKFKGYAASQGTYTGTVRVVRNPTEFSKVQKGEVLVCRTTTPAWTTLFSVVGAIITDAGGILSHAGTVAREYKLPAVLGTKVATTLLRDGQTVTVDGTQGVVIIHG